MSVSRINKKETREASAGTRKLSWEIFKSGGRSAILHEMGHIFLEPRRRMSRPPDLPGTQARSLHVLQRSFLAGQNPKSAFGQGLHFVLAG
ncbi:MAG: hypothetical protein LBC93_01815, partial [Synergistaceae bacterium]|nr:hypothetical protein [Synergistaceae bacterium]